MDNFFIFRENALNIQNYQIISNEHKKTVRQGREAIKFGTPSLWTTLHEGCKLANSSKIFKEKLKTCNAKNMPLSVMPNFSKRSWFYLTLFICVCFCLFFVLFYCCCCCCCLDFFFTVCFIVVAMFLQFPILWRELMNVFPTF